SSQTSPRPTSPSPHSSHATPACGQYQFGVMAEQSAAHPAEVSLPSSQASPRSTIPFPQNRQAPPSEGQVQPASVVQSALQPSPSVVLPSSQSSVPKTTRFPHTSHRERDNALLAFEGKQLHPSSTVQLE